MCILLVAKDLSFYLFYTSHTDRCEEDCISVTNMPQSEHGNDLLMFRACASCIINMKNIEYFGTSVVRTIPSHLEDNKRDLNGPCCLFILVPFAYLVLQMKRTGVATLSCGSSPERISTIMAAGVFIHCRGRPSIQILIPLWTYSLPLYRTLPFLLTLFFS